MKHLFLWIVLALFALASTANLDRNERDVQIRVKRQSSWFQSLADRKKKDKKKKKKDKKKKDKKTATVKPTTPTTIPVSTTTPKTTSIPKIPESEMKKMKKIRSRAELEKYAGVTPAIKNAIMVNYTKQLPKDIAREIAAQSVCSAYIPCTCEPALQREFIKDRFDPPLGIHIPGCITTFRCSGSCGMDSELECRPTSKRHITHPIVYYYHSYLGVGKEEHQLHTVEHHDKCGCFCKPKQCNKRQSFEEVICSCKCKPEYSKENLKCSEKKVDGMPHISWQYNLDTCSCECPLTHQVCAPSKVWDKKLCKCVLDCKKCKPGEIQNKDSCKCSVVAMNSGT